MTRRPGQSSFYVYEGPTPSYANYVMSLPPEEAFHIIDTYARITDMSYSQAYDLFSKADFLLSKINLRGRRYQYYDHPQNSRRHLFN